jgi:competence protein ComEA
MRALDAQIARVDSARQAGRAGKPARATRRSAAKREVSTVQPVTDVAKSERLPVDLDVATVAAIESLPWIGPSLAARIVESRERCGAFGSIDALKRVYGIGEGMAKRLAPHVTFSTPSRPMIAGQAPGCRDSVRSAASRRRTGHD